MRALDEIEKALRPFAAFEEAAHGGTDTFVAERMADGSVLSLRWSDCETARAALARVAQVRAALEAAGSALWYSDVEPEGEDRHQRLEETLDALDGPAPPERAQEPA